MQFVAVAVGFVALAAALLSCHHDIIVGYLGLFQHRLCKSEELETNWFSQQHSLRLLKARGFRDFSFGFLVSVVGVVQFPHSLSP